MEEKNTYAEQMMKTVKEMQNTEQTNYFNVENSVDDGYILVKYSKLELEQKELLGGRLLMVLPKEYQEMEQEMALAKYPDEDRPELIYTNEDTTVNFTYSIEEGEVSELEVREITNLLKREMMRLNPGCKLEDDEMLETKQGKKIGLFSMEIPTLDGAVFQLTYFMALKDGLLIGAFNCNKYDKKEWKSVIKQLLETIEEKE